MTDLPSPALRGDSARTLRPFHLVAYVLLAAGLLLVAVAVVSAFRVVRPRQVTPSAADAVAVLAGGQGERGELALELMDRGVAPVLVINEGNRRWDGWEDLAPLCEGAGTDYEVICVVSSPDNTAGEAAVISALAEEEGWESMVLVTSDYHLHRSTIRFEMCFDGEIAPLAADSAVARGIFVDEWLGTMEALLLDRGCG